jgi:hypothetical protein
MLEYLLALVGGFLIGNSMLSEETDEKDYKYEPLKLEDGGDIDEKYQIKDVEKDKYYALNIGQPQKDVPNAYKKSEYIKWNDSPDMGYTFDKDRAEKIKEQLEKEGYKNLEVVKYNKDWWKMADGGDVEEDMSVQFIDYKDKMIMFEPHFKKYYSNDIEFDSLEKAKKYIDAGSKTPAWQKEMYRREVMAKGGKVKFKDKVSAIEKKLEGQDVPRKYKKEYGKKYDKKEAKVAAQKIVGASLKYE